MDESKKKIHVVEDEANILNLVELLVRSIGHEPYCFSSGEAALAAARTSCPDLLLTDYRMPGMNGVELIEAVRATVSKTIPIILISGDQYAQGQLRLFVRNLTRVEFVSKPFETKSVTAQIQRMLLESENPLAAEESG